MTIAGILGRIHSQNPNILRSNGDNVYHCRLYAFSCLHPNNQNVADRAGSWT